MTGHEEPAQGGTASENCGAAAGSGSTMLTLIVADFVCGPAGQLMVASTPTVAVPVKFGVGVTQNSLVAQSVAVAFVPRNA